MASREKCLSCHKVCGKDMLHCKSCDGCCHLKCAGISEGTFREIQPIVNFSWNCDECVKHYDGDMMGSVIGKINNLGKEMSDLVKEGNSMMVDMNG